MFHVKQRCYLSKMFHVKQNMIWSVRFLTVILFYDKLGTRIMDIERFRYETNYSNCESKRRSR